MKPLDIFTHRLSSAIRSMSAGLVGMMLVTAVACDGADEPILRWGADAGESSSIPSAGAYVLDPDHSFIHFAAQHMVVGTVRGRFNTIKGTAVVQSDPWLSTVDVVIEAASIDTQNAPRDAELRGPDFFDTKTFPTITYQGTAFRRVGDRWNVDGSLTIRGVTQKVPLELMFNGTAPPRANQPQRIAIRASGAVRRKDFGMVRGLLDEIGTVSARPDVVIEIDAEFLADSNGPVPRTSTRRSKLIDRR